MPQRVGIERIEDLINVNDVKYYFSVNDVNQKISTEVTELKSRYVTKTYTKTGTGVYNLEVDSEGYKVLRCPLYTDSGTDYRNATDTITANNNETWIAVCNIPNGTTGVGLISKSSAGQLLITEFNYGNFTVGSGRIQMTPLYNTKIIITGVVNSSQQSIWLGLNKKNIINNPATSSLSTWDKIFQLPNTYTSGNLDYYCAIRIQNTYNEVTLKKLIRTIAFEHGVKI